MVQDVPLRAVYPIDFGHRVEDIGLWRSLLRPSYRLIEVGSGDGRVQRLVGDAIGSGTWVGIELDGDHVWRRDLETPMSIGDAAEPRPWDVALSFLDGGRADIVIIPYSTLFLIPHGRQGNVIRNAARSLRNGGQLVIEHFIPKLQRSGTAFKACIYPWYRRSTFEVSTDTQVTSVLREYGIDDQIENFRPLQRVTETIYWREVPEIAAMCRATHLFSNVENYDSITVPNGYAVTIATV